MMKNRILNILKSIILSWIVLFGVILNHLECQTHIPDACNQKELSFSIQHISVLPASTLALKSMTNCRKGVCCEEPECKDEKTILISGLYPDKIKQARGSGIKVVLTNNKAKRLLDGSWQNKIPKTSSIYILTQSFLC